MFIWSASSQYRMLQLDSCPDLAVAITLRQFSHVCIGCQFVNKSPSRRRYWWGKAQLRCICRSSVFQWPRCQVDSIYGRRLLESWWFKGSDDNMPAELCRQWADRLEQARYGVDSVTIFLTSSLSTMQYIVVISHAECTYEEIHKNSGRCTPPSWDTRPLAYSPLGHLGHALPPLAPAAEKSATKQRPRKNY